MSDMNFQNTLALRDYLNKLMPSVGLALSEQINREVSMTVVDASIVPMLSLQARIDTVLETTFSLNYPKSIESLIYISEAGALTLLDLYLGNNGANPPEVLNEDQVEILGGVMTGMLRGLSNVLGSLTGEAVELETNTTTLGSISLPPVFALEPNVVEALISLSIPGVAELELSLLLAPELAVLLVPDTSSEIDEMMSADDIQKMMSGLTSAEDSARAFSGGGMGDMGMMGGGSPFANFGGGAETPSSRPIDLIMDIPLEVTVELGRIRMLIKDVLDLASGSIVELDRVAGEPVDLLVNGRLVAKGEVVVIEDNFGIRITEIVSPAERVVGLGKGR
jgi:flagellar motor switch protein FliN